MLVITHKILLADLQLTQNFAALPIGDGLTRWNLSLPIYRDKFRDGLSLSDSLQSTAYCETGRDLYWYDVTSKTIEELDMDLWNKDVLPTAPFNGFLPYKEVAV
jgi:CRISPR/Cas system-associated exonuclease Cas4 (RecB family)